MFVLKLTAFFGTLHLASAQSFQVAIEAYPQLSDFADLLSTNPTIATSLLSTSASAPKTLLVPNNNAFVAYQAKTGVAVGNTEKDLLQDTLNYQTLNGSYTAESFSEPKGVTIPTLLTGETYNNRSAGAALASAAAGQKDGQVVFVSALKGTSGFTVRQLNSDAALVRSGLGSDVRLETTEGVWDGGRFHIIDSFLTLPQTCTTTIDSRGLSSLSASLDRTGLAPVLDTLKNVTCLGPNNAAFVAAGSPEVKLNDTELSAALMYSTIPSVLYTNFLQSGQMFRTANNLSVRVTLDGDDIYFNDARVVERNVLTNNGLIHVLDRIMSPLKSLDANGTSSTKTATSTARATSTPSPTVTATSTPSPTVVVSATASEVPTGMARNLKGNLLGLSLLQFGAVLAGFVF